jgi:hypothetical protein
MHVAEYKFPRAGGWLYASEYLRTSSKIGDATTRVAKELGERAYRSLWALNPLIF